MALRETPVRIRLRAASGRVTFAVPVLLTGGYGTDANTGDGERVSYVEIEIVMPAHGYRAAAWVPITDLETAHGEPMDYWEVRRALLILWIRRRAEELREVAH